MGHVGHQVLAQSLGLFGLHWLAWVPARRDTAILDPPQLSVIAFRLKGEGAAADARNEELLRRVNDRRRVFLSSTRIAGRYVLRICVLSFRTHEDRVLDAVTALREEASAIA